MTWAEFVNFVWPNFCWLMVFSAVGMVLFWLLGTMCSIASTALEVRKTTKSYLLAASSLVSWVLTILSVIALNIAVWLLIVVGVGQVIIMIIKATK